MPGFLRSLIDPYRLERFRMLLARFRPEPPEQPYASVRHPRARPSGGRSAAAAVEEPRELIRTDVAGRGTNTKT